MKVLFGSIEYFEKEIRCFARRKNYITFAREQVIEIYSEMKDELINDFICAEHIKKECLTNLNLASQRFLNNYQTLSNDELVVKRVAK